MKLEQFSDLYDRIQLEPSILLLGQNYLSMGGETDPVWEKLAEEYYPELCLPRRRADYPTLWTDAVKNEVDAERVMTTIAEAGKDIWDQPAVTAITKLRWSLLFTSAIDSTETMATAKGCTLVPAEERAARPMYMNKERRYRVDLCGNREWPPPALNSKPKRRQFDNGITTRISWIVNTYLRMFGVLVIDGLDPEYDWLTDETLFGQLYGLPRNTVFWFNAPKELEENALELVKEGILTVDHAGFYDNLADHMPELLESEAASCAPEEDPSLYTALTLRLGERKMQTIRISRSAISDITGANLCVIDDDILRSSFPSGKNRDQNFADFLTQEGLPSWHLFSSDSGISFYIQRDQDEAFKRLVEKESKESSVARKPVILYGRSNSGKSMMMANLALKIAADRKYPVIYIRGDLVQGAERRLDQFINNWFLDLDRLNGERVERIIVVWDGSGLKRTERDYETLQKQLFNRNVQVVGSAYVGSAEHSIELLQDLSSAETARLRSLLKSLGGGYCERFDEIRSAKNRPRSLENSTLLYLLQALFKFTFDNEYRSVFKVLAAQFKQEQQFAEQQTGIGLNNYVEEFFETQKRIAENGIASSFQESLRLILARMKVREEEQEKAQFSDEQKRKLEKREHLSKCIRQINRVLAVASEFGVALPLQLLLRFLRDKNGNSVVAYSEETAKIIEILRADTLIEFRCETTPRFGEVYYVRFRNCIEAENYICLMCDLALGTYSDKRREKEKALLLQIIEAADSDVELWSVIELARQFGPNGHGMLSELERMRKQNDYHAYAWCWLEIAEAIINKFPTDPEAALLYAHFTREYIRLDSKHSVYYADAYNNTRARLEAALTQMENDNQTDSLQYARLSVELCANYQQFMLDYGFNGTFYKNIKGRIRSAFAKSIRQESNDYRRDFSSNSLLDILLNAYGSYRASRNRKPMNEADNQELAQIICDIDVMLNLDDLRYERRASDLIKKVKEVYDQLETDSTQMQELERRLEHMNSDVLLYLQARMLWQRDAALRHDSNVGEDLDYLYSDRYMVVCRDIPYNRVEIPEELLEQARKDAAVVVEFLESREEDIRRTFSERCVVMLMRAKWLCKTGNTMLAEKQRVPFSRAEWDAFNALCNQYHSYHENRVSDLQENFIPAYFLKGIYEWVYGDAKQSLDWFSKAKSAVRENLGRTVDRLVLCSEKTQTPRTFKVMVKKKENRNYAAEIKKETTPIPSFDMVATRYNIGVSDVAAKYLFDGTLPKEHLQLAKREGVVRFNLIGPQIGIPQSGGSGNGQ